MKYFFYFWGMLIAILVIEVVVLALVLILIIKRNGGTQPNDNSEELKQEIFDKLNKAIADIKSTI